jgi:hypothetical protein
MLSVSPKIELNPKIEHKIILTKSSLISTFNKLNYLSKKKNKLNHNSSLTDLVCKLIKKHCVEVVLYLIDMYPFHIK